MLKVKEERLTEKNLLESSRIERYVAESIIEKFESDYLCVIRKITPWLVKLLLYEYQYHRTPECFMYICLKG